MRRETSWIGLGLALAVASAAAAQDGPRPRVTVVVKSPTPTAPPPAKPAPPTAGQPLLRKPLRAAVAAPHSVQAPLPRSGATPAVAALPVANAGFTPLRGLNGPSASAQAAQCRAECAQARYLCTAHQAGDCDTVWGECVVRCSGANSTDTPDLALSTGYRPGP